MIYTRYSNTGGLFDEILNLFYYDKNPRKFGWSNQMIKDKTDAIHIYWFVNEGKHKQNLKQVEMSKAFVDLTGK